MRLILRVLLMALASALFDDAAAGSPIACDPKLGLTYWESTALAAESQFGLFLGVSEGEFTRVAALAQKSGLYNYFQDKSWIRSGETLYVIDPPEHVKDRTVVMQTALFKDHILVFLGDQIEDRLGSKSLTRQEAGEIVRDYRRYMCWRFGAVAERSTLGPETRNAILGPAQIYEQASAGNGRISMDAFVTEDIKSKSDSVMLIIVTRATSFGAD